MNVPCHALMPAKWSEAHEEDKDDIMVPHTYVPCTRQSPYIRERDDGPPEFCAANIIVE